MASKLLIPREIGIHSETDRLRVAAVAGLPSVEQELAQLFPTNQSLFLDRMDVLTARNELHNFAATMAANGVDVLPMKQELAKLLEGQGLSKDAVLKGLFEKADGLLETYGSSTSSTDLKERIAHLIALDTQMYGEEGALALAKALCLDNGYPLGNIIYARDQTNVVFGMRIVANMAYDIRVPEVALYEQVYSVALGPHTKITLNPGEIFEGGSLYVHDNTVYMDVDPRTNMAAAFHIFHDLHERYPTATYVIVKNGNKGEEFEEQQQSMHLDTFSMPIGKNAFAVCDQESSKRKVYIVKFAGGEEPHLIPTNKSFIEYLQDEGYEVVAVGKNEQKTFGCNILMLDGSTAFMPTAASNAVITQALRDRGTKVIEVPMEATTNGFGATHCAVGQLKRE